VRVLQTHLSALARAGLVSFPAEPPAGAVFDEATRRAVVAFQSARRLVPDGAVDAATWRALTEASPLRPVSLLRSPTAALPGAALPATTAQGQSIVYLTFDDGPNPPFTQGMLETLARYGAKATFFEVGQQVKAFPAVVREVASAGHYVANHTFDHHTLEGISRQNFVQEAQETRGLILDAAGSVFGLDHDVRYLRPPYGATDANTREFAAALGYTLVLWDVDPQDWRRPGTAQIASHVLSHVHPGAIVLMHDGGGPRDQSVAALDTILREIAAGGYVSHTIFDRFNGTPAAPGAPAAPAAPAGPGAPGTLRVTGTGGSGLNIHGAPSRSAPVVVAVTEGTVLTDLGGSQEADGLSWRQVRTAGGATGWAAAQFLAG
jgi:peptidoglycan/xylan/chitin deacetylase (PgdA/CDA1 family)